MYRLTKLSAALLLAGFAGAASAGWNQLDLNQPSNLDKQPDVVYQGSFNYNGQTYGPSAAVAVPPQASATIASVFDLNALQAFTLYGKNGPGGTGHNDDLSLTSNDNSSAAGVKTPVVYRIYRQNYSAATVNLARGTEGRHFVKHIIGEQTAPGTLVNGTYNYAGVTFSNFPRGMFDYQVTVTGPSAATGEGSFSLNEIKIPARISSTGKNIVFDITNGKLDPAALATTSNGLVFAGDVTITANDVSNSKAWEEIGGLDADPTYSLTLFGPNGAEIAGTITGLPERIGGVAVIGAKQ
ncbi:hypothetical protein HMPREF3069_32795 [Achromobacter xylosoxidans]|uniref:hypothetical protein n=1 Tax=Alcaligenes xylosoxydans xylosoxydans TaxID=85698 RepID=UPI0006BF8DF4|nr:hypothetical protein [Achromobacter xylosoxidans]OFL38251.1 hypothetical protein HMPREF2772_26085 [Achromobacter xylosoxidans]OFS27976.1 hypothetical protein HMPREF3069_32795 [Achromobacter xylosoxidans]CUJ62836.1 Uncharacterised protein [Achromobacter xylosoxidans]